MTNRLRWLGHSAWQLTTSSGRVLLIDPWLDANPMSPIKVADLPAAQYVLLTHDHSDHAADCVAVVKRTGATLIAQPETVARYKADGADPVMGMNVGGAVDLDGISVTMVDAYHSSQTGTPAGYILTLEDGKVLYHAGDTCLHANMKTWAELFSIDVALLPIGGRFTMDARQAARSVAWLKAKAVLPMHYRTFPLLAASADDFVRLTREEAPAAKVVVIEPGAEFAF
jgi:L-ascorbate metabolism protein UlaG (beta-lactamase superfamily)